MRNDTILRILRDHSVPCYELDGRIYADTMIAYTEEFSEVADLTGYTVQQLRDWLGY